MEPENKKVISIRLVYVILFLIGIIVAIGFGIKYYKTYQNNNILQNNIGMVEQENLQLASRTTQEPVSSRAEELSRNKETTDLNSEEKAQVTNTDEMDENNIKATNAENKKESISNEENEEEANYISIQEVKISKNMDLTVRTGLSKQDFISLIAGVKQDTSGFFEENAEKIYDLCEQYSLNEIFFCGIISAESGWNIAQNHRKTHNYISLMSNGKLIRYSSVESGLTEAARVLHTNYLSKGGKYYYGKTLSAVKTKFCPASSTWVNLVYGRMSQIVK